MAEKKMTQVKALEIAVEVLGEYGALDEQVEARDILAGMIEKAEGPMTNAELAAVMEVKPQKIANNIRVLEKAEKVVRIRGEKASDKDTFVLA